MDATRMQFWDELEYEIMKHPTIKFVKFIPRFFKNETWVHGKYWSEKHQRYVDVITVINDNALFEAGYSVPIAPFVKAAHDAANEALLEGPPILTTNR